MSNLWRHQLEGVKRATARNNFGFFFDVGTGKTRTAIETIRTIYSRHERLLPTVIISPVITLENWKSEILKYSKIPESSITVLKGTGDKKYKQALESSGIIITNYESLLNDNLFAYLKNFLSIGASVLICDESHYVKSPTAKRTKCVLALAKVSQYRYILSGTPILNNAEDIWSQAFILDLGERFGDKFHRFKMKFFEDKNAGWKSSSKHFPNWQLIKSTVPYFNEKLAEISMSVKKSECLDIPPFVKTELEVEMSPRQKKHYNEMKEDFISYVSDEVACVSSIAIVKALRMQEIASGYMKLDTDEVVEFEDNPRMDALDELVDLHTPNHKIIIWSCFKQNHEMIARMLRKKKIEYVMLTGNESAQQKFDAMDKFQTDSKVRVCIGSQAVGIGINLVESSMSIYYSRNFNLGHDIQSEARNYRAGSERHEAIYRIDMVAKDSLDKHVLQALTDKKSLSAQILRDFVI